MADHLISILLPTRNGEAHLRRLLPALAAQELPAGWRSELRAIDSSSEDASARLLEEAGAAVQSIAREDFGHGRTRNLLAEGAGGELLVYLSQDAQPADGRFLAGLIAAFDDGRTAGATSRILPRADDDPLTARTALDLPQASPEARAVDLDGIGDLARLPPGDRAALFCFNNVAGAVRASALRELPFPDVPFGEDQAWASRALSAGWRLRTVPASVVYHAHRYGPRQAFERNRTDAAFQRAVHGLRVRPSVLAALRGLLYEVRADLRYLGRSPAGPRLGPALISPFLRGAQVLGQYAGSRGWGGPRFDSMEGSV